MNYSYVTVMSTENYLLGLLTMYESLKQTKTKYPLTVIVNEEISNKTINILKNNGITVIVKPKFKVDREIIDKNDSSKFSHWSNTFDKLYIFELTQFDKIIYIDSDMLVLKNLDHLFEKPNLSAVVAGNFYPGNGDWVKLNSGLMVIKPEAGILSKFVSIMKQMKDRPELLGDQNIIQEYAPNWEFQKELHLGHEYNLFFSHLEYYIHELNHSLSEIAIVHFITKEKPWLLNEEQKKAYIEKWKNFECSNVILSKYFEILESVNKALLEV